jgi:hypothetical protein
MAHPLLHLKGDAHEKDPNLRYVVMPIAKSIMIVLTD